MADIIAIARLDGKTRKFKPFLHKRKKRSARAWAFGSCIGAMMLIVSGALTPAVTPVDVAPSAPGEIVSQQFQACTNAKRITCVVDGDTLWLSGSKIRIADIDTPEIGAPRCPYEQTQGLRATARLIELLNAAPFEVRSLPGRDEDRYGRKLRLLYRDGSSIGDALAAEGLAHKWDARRSWC